MTVNRKPTGRALSMPAGLAAGGAGSLGLTLFSTAVIAKLMEAETVKESATGYFALVILFLSALTGAMVACGLIKHRRLLVSVLSGAVYYAVLLAMTALFFGGQYQGMLSAALAVLTGTMLAAFFGLHRTSTKRKVKRFHR